MPHNQHLPWHLVAFAAIVLLASAVPSSAALVQWNIDSTQSFVRLNIPDQSVSLDGIPATIRLRDATSSTVWTDNGGRRAFVGGTLSTDYQYSSYQSWSIAFNGGQHNLWAIESGSFRPNPAAFDPNVTNTDNPNGQYVNTTGAPAAFAARLRSALLALPDVAMIAFRDVVFDVASGVIPIDAGGNFAGGSNTFGLASAVFDADGFAASLAGQPFADTYHAPIGEVVGTNTGGGKITDLGLLHELRLTVNAPFQFEFGGATLNASFTGQIIAYPLIPEPSTLAMAGVAAFGLCWAGRRRFRRF